MPTRLNELIFTALGDGPNGAYISPGWGVSTVPWVLTHGIKRSKNRSPGWGDSEQTLA
ncbi:hypothetical protein LF1_25550 [Rubripirellula obstinata]|uniref:Uncharacterized protein n=1 Tax=Rubripirellula obstinata TaxID=406547 RepID=A0A5B1CFN9_9BACT|nr:hypothetical protein [Rubripirellula obstinata]KAA1260017.1 hypothetical protein LF1_25550 [Rubripirellula obstinata]